MKIKYYLKNVDGLIVPARANETDAGYDVTATSGPKIVGKEGGNGWYAIDYIEYETNLYFVPMPQTTLEYAGEITFRHSSGTSSNFDKATANFHTDLRPRSSISSKTNFVLANSIGLIDRGYHNQVLVRFKYIWQPEDLKMVGMEPFSAIQGVPNHLKMYMCGDKIAQILPVTTHDIEFQLIEFLPGEDRGGGFGSSDSKGTP